MSSFNIIVTHIIKKDKKGYFGHCPELDVCSQGKTIKETEANLKEAVTLYLETIDQLGIKDKILKERQIVLNKQKSKVKKKGPIELLIDRRKVPFIITQSINFS